MALIGKEKSRDSHGRVLGSQWAGRAPPGAVIKWPQLIVGIGITSGFPCLICAYLCFLRFL